MAGNSLRSRKLNCPGGRKLIEESADSGVAAIRIWDQEVPVAHDFLVQSAQAKPFGQSQRLYWQFDGGDRRAG